MIHPRRYHQQESQFHETDPVGTNQNDSKRNHSPHGPHGPHGSHLLCSSHCPPCPPGVLLVLSAQWKREFSKPDFLSTVGNGRWGAGTQCQCRSVNLSDLVKGMWRRVYFVWNWKIFELQIKLFAGFCMGGVLEYAWMKFAVLVFEPADECP